MFFEGSEKKLEIIVSPEVGSLRQLPTEFWHEMVKACEAQILSEVNSNNCRAYLLSESSLFVWEEQLTLITCGTTNLVNSALYFLEKFPGDKVSSLIYQRKNEYFPHLQQSDFYSDAEILQSKVPGRALRFGPADEHHLYLFHMNKEYSPDPEDSTLEMLMYSVDDRLIEKFRQTNLKASDCREALCLTQLFPGFSLDDYLFTPEGYSVNGLSDSDYFTIHVTPQELGCFISFESNLHLREGYEPLLQRLLEIFKPKSFDLVNFQPRDCEEMTIPGYQQRSLVKENLICGYGVVYSHFFQPELEAKPAYLLNLASQRHNQEFK